MAPPEMKLQMSAPWSNLKQTRVLRRSLHASAQRKNLGLKQTMGRMGMKAHLPSCEIPRGNLEYTKSSQPPRFLPIPRWLVHVSGGVVLSIFVTRKFTSRNVKPRPIQVKVWKGLDLDASKVSFHRAGLHHWWSPQLAEVHCYTAGQISVHLGRVNISPEMGWGDKCALLIYIYLWRCRCLRWLAA